MKRFKFRLQRVLAWRRQDADAARRVLVAAVTGLNRCDERIAVIDRLAMECRQESASRSPAQALAAGMLVGLDTARGRAQRARAAADKQVALARTMFLQRRSAAEAITKLHTQKRTAWQTTIDAAERAELEELSRLARHAETRRSAEEPGGSAASDRAEATDNLR